MVSWNIIVRKAPVKASKGREEEGQVKEPEVSQKQRETGREDEGALDVGEECNTQNSSSKVVVARGDNRVVCLCARGEASLQEEGKGEDFFGRGLTGTVRSLGANAHSTSFS